MRNAEIVPAPVMLDELGEWNHPALPCFLSDMDEEQMKPQSSNAASFLISLSNSSPFISLAPIFLPVLSAYAI